MRIAHASAPSSERRVLDDLLEHRVGIELGREQAARARELLRERAGAPLRLVELAALERAARRVRELAGELEVVVGEAALVREADEDDAAAARQRVVSSGTASSASQPASRGERLPLVAEARVAGERRRGDHATLLPRRASEHLRPTAAGRRRAPARERRRQLEARPRARARRRAAASAPR